MHKWQVWNAEGGLISRLLREVRFEGWSAFRPVGNMIGVSSKGRVIMAERNGQARNGVLKVDEVVENGRIREGGWNADGRVLAIQVEKIEERKSVHYLTLWVCSNFDWSCKLCLPFADSIPAWKWSNERWNELIVVSSSKEVLSINLSLIYHSSNGVICTPGLSSARLTNLRRVVIPPPMAEVCLPLPAPPAALSLRAGTLLVVDAHQSLHHYAVACDASSALRAELHGSFALSLPPNSIVTSVELIDDEYAIGATHSSVHYLIRYANDGKELSRRDVVRAVIGGKKESDGTVSLLLDDGTIVNESTYIASSAAHDSSSIHDYRFVEDGVGAYVLRASSTLYDNDLAIAKAVSSFAYFAPFLAWIDNEFRLHLLDTHTKEKADVRSVEKGARIVSNAPPKMILQMPRGNLETIHARFFVVRSIRSLLEEGEVRIALLEMRKHGVPFTLLKEYDHFFSTSTKWLNDISDANLLSAVIAELRSDSKNDAYCDALTCALLSLSAAPLRRLLPAVLTSLLLQAPPQTNTAFECIVRHLPDDGTRATQLRKWLQVCAFFLNPARIFQSSLSTYNLTFVVEVVEALSIDPNEYMSTLRELNQLSDLSYRAYKMDMLREDWSSALRNLANCDPPRIDEVVELIKSKTLYALALEIYGDTVERSPMLNTIGRLALDKYMKDARWREAAAVARMLHQADDEMACREKLGDVRGWIRVLNNSGIMDEKKAERKNQWMDSLIKASKWNTVAELADHVDCTWQERIEYKEKGKDWQGVVAEAERDERAEARAREILTERSLQIEREIDEKLNDIRKWSARLNVVREKKKTLLERMVKGEMALEDLERCDAFSESSMASSSRSSSSSRASTVSRRRKKIEKKKSSLKEGGEWEDAALLIVCHEHWRALRLVMVECAVLLPCLIAVRLLVRRSALHAVLEQLEASLVQLAPSIFPSRLHPHHLIGPLAHIYEENKTMSGEGSIPSSILMEPEMAPPPPYTDKEKEWRTAL